MSNRSNNSAWILVVVLAVCLQVVFVFADCKQTATGTAINFSKAYFLLDADMEAFMCNELIGDEEDSAAFSHIKAMRDEAGDRGFGIGMVQRTITGPGWRIRHHSPLGKQPDRHQSHLCLRGQTVWPRTDLYLRGDPGAHQ